MQKQNVKSEYEIQAETFLKEYAITYTAVFLFHGPHWEGDKDFRDVYECILKREGKRPLTVRFGQSQRESRNYWKAPKGYKGMGNRIRYDNSGRLGMDGWMPTKVKAPSAYSLLAALTKYDPGSFENFCGEYGYDTDSRKAENTYRAVVAEWHQVRAFFTDTEIEKLAEIN